MTETLEFCARLHALGCDFVVVSSGGVVWGEKIPTAPGFQVPFGVEIRKKTGMLVTAVGLIREPQQAEEIIASGQANMVSLARGMLWDPRWAWHTADVLNAKMDFPSQYSPAQPQLVHDTFVTREAAREH